MAKTYNSISTFTSGQILTAAQMNAIGENSNNFRVPPAVRVTLSSSSRSNGDTTVSWTSAAEYDTEPIGDKMHSTSVNPSRLTIRTAGLYVIHAGGNWGVSVTGSLRSVNILQNGNFVCGNCSARNQFDGAQVQTSVVMSLSVGQYLEMQTGQNTGGALTMTNMFFSASWIGQAS
jgi:hypothetical protein